MAWTEAMQAAWRAILRRAAGWAAGWAAWGTTATAMLLAACSVAGPRESPLPHDGPTLVEVYREHIATEAVGRPRATQGSHAAPPATTPGGVVAGGAPDDCAGPLSVARDCLNRRPVRDDDADLLQVGAMEPAPTLEAVLQRFQRLPNPDLVMYVFPHLARGRYPVPGYYTAFPLYETVEYALPGELPQRLRRATRAAVPTDVPGRTPGASETAQAGRGR